MSQVLTVLAFAYCFECMRQYSMPVLESLWHFCSTVKYMHSVRPNTCWRTLPWFPKCLNFLSQVSKLTKYHCLNHAFPSSSLLGQMSTEFVAYTSVSWRYTCIWKMTSTVSHRCTKRDFHMFPIAVILCTTVVLGNKSGMKISHVFFCV